MSIGLYSNKIPEDDPGRLKHRLKNKRRWQRFYSLVMHCSKRRKTDYVEGLFGYATRLPDTMFSAAVYYEDAPHPDCLVRISDAETYECKDGRWWHTLAFETSASSSELGLAMHAVDYQDLDETPEETAGTTEVLARHATHLARLLKESAYPAGD